MGSLSPIVSASSALGTVIPGLGAVTPILGAANQVVNAFNDPSKDDKKNLVASQQQALRQLQQTQAEQTRNLEETTALEREKLLAQAQADEADRLAALRRAVARQNVQFASQGISSTGGSSDAVLLGLFEESEEDRTERERLDNIRSKALDQELESTQRLNVLQRSQLAEQQRLERATSGLF